MDRCSLRCKRRCRHEHDGGVVAQRADARRRVAAAERATRVERRRWRRKQREREVQLATTRAIAKTRHGDDTAGGRNVPPRGADAGLSSATYGVSDVCMPARRATPTRRRAVNLNARSGSSRVAAWQATRAAPMCDALASERAVFIVALGRSGSSHLLHLLNAIPGYRVSGETENAWLHLARHARAAPNPAAAAVPGWPSLNASTLPRCETWEPFSERAGARALRLDPTANTAQAQGFPGLQGGAEGESGSTRRHAEVTPQLAARARALQSTARSRAARAAPAAPAVRRRGAVVRGAAALLAAHNPPPRPPSSASRRSTRCGSAAPMRAAAACGCSGRSDRWRRRL